MTNQVITDLQMEHADDLVKAEYLDISSLCGCEEGLKEVWDGRADFEIDVPYWDELKESDKIKFATDLFSAFYNEELKNLVLKISNWK